MRLVAAFIVALAAAPASAQTAQDRVAFADKLDTIFLDRGLNFKVTAQREEKTELRIGNVLMNRAMVYQLAKADVLKLAKAKGFKRVIFTDGYGHSFYFDISAWAWTQK